MTALLWLKGLLVRRAGYLAGTVLGVALTVALLASLGAFIASSASSMTQRAIAGVPWTGRYNSHLAVTGRPQ